MNLSLDQTLDPCDECNFHSLFLYTNETSLNTIVKMATCAVKWCGKSSRTSSFNKDGIAFHRFPSAPERKTKWIEATGRGDNWFPQTYSVICSRHFTEDNFLAIKDRRRLMDSAVPTIYLPVLNPNPSPSPSAKIPQPNVAVKEEILEEPQKQSKRIPPLPTSPSEYESPTEKRLCRRIMELTNSVRLKNIKLKKYRDSNRRLKRIVQSLKSRIAEMEKSD